MSGSVNGFARPTPERRDPFFYGWRYVRRVDARGKEHFDEVPLTEEDVLHPQLDDVVSNNTAHGRDTVYLNDVFAAQVAGDPTALVTHDVIVVWGDRRLRHHSPDVAVTFGVRDPKRLFTRFHVAKEGVRPALIVEVVSESSRRNDLVTKVAHYAKAGVPLYVVVDRRQPDGPPELIGYRLAAGRFERVDPAADGRLFLGAVRVYLGTVENRVVCFDAATGQELGDYVAVTRALEEAEARAEAQATQADAAEKRADAAKKRADAAKKRADAAKKRAERERRARAAAEERVRKLEVELARLRGREK